MSLANYTDLVSSIGNWLKRDNLTAVIPDFIALAEARLARDLRVRAMETSASGALSSDTLPLPSDAVEPKSLTVMNGSKPMRVAYVSPDTLSDSQGYSAFPRVFTLIGKNIVMAPAPDSAYSYTLMYYAKLPALAANGTNWLMTNCPDVYLYGSLLQAAPYLKDDARLPVWEQLYKDAFESTEVSDDRSAQFTMRVRTDVRV
ncbi:hypothetical protein HQ393_04920 [Chitinibacter bivalviorum]|uniref:Uncharacterized protein n=1 Tax=Chitinibacter bivalviorum TaxID=2739434 RepID=A0A7H9BHG9_9NEIS|nr:hypothetical protein [Chitinibacter bivalviorum]QLG87648.1 hypothetical protein HQ393_04920 [Chitinibacter bivalviorum]